MNEDILIHLTQKSLKTEIFSVNTYILIDTSKKFYPFIFYKIGKSKDCYYRSKRLQWDTYKGGNLKLIAEYPYNIEKVLHIYLKDYKIENERELFEECNEIKELITLFNSFSIWNDKLYRKLKNSKINNFKLYIEIAKLKKEIAFLTENNKLLQSFEKEKNNE